MAKIKNKVAVVIPTIRESSFNRFLEEWKEELLDNKKFDVRLIVIEDNPSKTFLIKEHKNISHYSWKDIETELKKDSWIIPRRTDCVRSYGYFKAYQMNPDIIITLDDDCYPLYKYLPNEPKLNFIDEHWKKLTSGTESKDCWVSTIKDLRPRGIPYKNISRNKKSYPILNHGLWYNVPDFDGMTQMQAKQTSNLKGYAIQQNIPKGMYFPMCGMNLAWKSEATPALYFLLMGKDRDNKPWGFERFGDIWSGIIFKKIADHLNFDITSGSPIIWHDRASDPISNMNKEKPGIIANEFFWEVIDNISLKGNSFKECYKEVADGLLIKGDYWKKLKKAMNIWSELF